MHTFTESLRTPDLPCPIGTICCPSLNTCTTASKCDKAYSSKCASIPDDGILCASLNTYDVCLSNNILESAQNQTCPQGTVCCADGINRCDFRFNCGAVLPMTSVVEATSFLPKINPAANVCTSVADNVQACINPTIITTCLQGHAASLGQACQKGTKCCAGNCVPPGSPSCNTCNGVPNAEIACTSVDSYTICMNQNPLTVPQKCAKGTVCCGNACVSIKDPACVAEVPVVSNLGVIESSQPLLLKSMSVQSLNDDICRGLTDNNIACLTATTFVFCSGK
ncbi:hypothetical protein BC830DRAFT_168106 [Chytriomyces sp. MP71]|nr:hypothetical protein BC830DRAFT_168106 [Chytriomyces sp. MP71]